ncbi:hypothetical protein CWI38_0114p0020 [Hamiltosporidium tvaerminnensis]|uniref:Uncharacterized protein n=1 Tax=Hamiltosporidium tvaerminnensis TaxID=1176355 RepID=A0A4Q9M2H3_9MICR|nr:hypothetical protein CWI38_0114p0020 [Hamiltosporidium tvaerminnensis]
MLRNGWPDTLRYHSEKSHCPLDIGSVVRTRKLQSKLALSQNSRKTLRKIIREFNLDLSRINDLSESLVKKNEFLDVYAKKQHFMKLVRNFEERPVCLSCSDIMSIVTKFQNNSLTMWNENIKRIHVYKYIGIIEDSRGILTNKSLKELDDAVQLQIGLDCDVKKRSARPRDEAVYFQHCNQSRKIVDALVTRCEKIPGYTMFYNIMKACRGKKDTRIKTDVRIRCNRPDLLVLDKRRNKRTNAMNDRAYIQYTVLRRNSKYFLSEPNAKESRECVSLSNIREF